MDRIDVVDVDEVLDVDRPIGLPRRLEILVGDVDVLALRDLVAADEPNGYPWSAPGNLLRRTS